MEELLKKQRKIDEIYFPGVKQNTSLEYWGCAIGVESGELLNILKKMARNRFKRKRTDEPLLIQTLDQEYTNLIPKVAEESADVVIYLLILSDVLGFNLKKWIGLKQDTNVKRIEIQVHPCPASNKTFDEMTKYGR